MSWSDPKEGGHGALGYDRSYKGTGEFWSRSRWFAIACHLRGQCADMRDAMTSFMASHHPWIRNSHAYGEPGGSLGLLGLNLAAPDSYRKVIREYAWWFSLAWETGYGLRFTTPAHGRGGSDQCHLRAGPPRTETLAAHHRWRTDVLIEWARARLTPPADPPIVGP